MEVYGIAYDRLAGFLRELWPRGPGGQELRRGEVVPLPTGSVDFTMPRRESKTGPQHRDFHATFDESITPREAASRRDFTINAIGYDPVHGEILDFFGGREDLKNRVLRATSEAFCEDPLRVLRGMQFACRFDLTLDPATADVSRSIAGEYVTLARERVAEEFMKWAVKSERPGRMAEYLAATGWIVHFPEIGALDGVPQDPGWHPEGDVDTHTMLVVDAAARVAKREGLEGDERAVLLFGALCHDFAKAATTALREREGKMRWTSWGHEADGGPMARAFLERIGIKSAIVEQVVPLVENHLASSSVGRDLTPRAVRRLATALGAGQHRAVAAVDRGRSFRPSSAPRGVARGRCSDS